LRKNLLLAIVFILTISAVVTVIVIAGRTYEQNGLLFCGHIGLAVLVPVLGLLVFRRIGALARTEAKLRISEEEYRIATRHSNKLILRLDIATRTTYRQSDIPTVFGVPIMLENVPESIINDGKVAPDSVETLRSFYNAIYTGEREGSAVVSMYDVDAGDFKWYHFDFTSIFDDSGKPAQAIISFYDVTLQRQKELAFQRWQQSFNAIPKSAANYYEYNLTADALEHEEGGMLAPLPDNTPRNLADVSAYIAKRHIYREDVKGWLAFMDRDRLLERYAGGLHTDKTEFRRLGGGTPLWTSLNLQLIPDPYSSDVKAIFSLRTSTSRRRPRSICRSAPRGTR
jgi:PAS domain-containing protein